MSYRVKHADAYCDKTCDVSKNIAPGFFPRSVDLFLYSFVFQERQPLMTGVLAALVAFEELRRYLI